MIEVLSGNGHDENGIVDDNIRRLRLERKNFWMKVLRNFVSDRLNERSKDLIPGGPIGTNFYLIGRSGEKNNRCHKSQILSIF